MLWSPDSQTEMVAVTAVTVWSWSSHLVLASETDIKGVAAIPSGSARDPSYKPSSRLPLLSDRPAVTFPASERHRLWPISIHTAAKQGTCVCRCVTAERSWTEHASSTSLVQRHTCCATTPLKWHWLEQYHEKKFMMDKDGNKPAGGDDSRNSEWRCVD